MKTKQELAMRVMQNANEEARELLEHAQGVAKFILNRFPDLVPESIFDAELKSTESAFLGKFRKPEETGSMMLVRCRERLERFDTLEKDGDT